MASFISPGFVRDNGVWRCHRRVCPLRGGRGRGRVQRIWMGVSVEVGQVVAGRYELVERIGEGATSITFLGRDKEKGGERSEGEVGKDDVVVKVLALKGLNSWKTLELFQRESATLASISHPSIPTYIDSFEEDTDDDRLFFLVQRRAPGKSLQELVESKWRAEPEQVRRILLQLLEVCDYLETLSPPVVHRDIKPSNVVIDQTDRNVPVSLVDFGAVVESAGRSSARLGSTMIGTFGYMAPEQFSGAANSSTDLYGVGATMVFLLTHQEPGSLPQQRLRMDFRSAIERRYTDSESLERTIQVVERLTQPAPEDRFRTARETIRALEGKAPASVPSPFSPLLAIGNTNEPPGEVTAPKGSRLEVRQSGNQLSIRIPPGGWSGDSLTTAAFALTWNGVVGMWTLGAVTGGTLPMALFSLPFWMVGTQLLKRTAKGVTEELDFTVDDLTQTLSVSSTLLRERDVVVSLADLKEIRLKVSSYVNGVPISVLELEEGANTYRFAEGLNRAELEYLHALLHKATGKGSFAYKSQKERQLPAFDRRDDFFDERW